MVDVLNEFEVVPPWHPGLRDNQIPGPSLDDPETVVSTIRPEDGEVMLREDAVDTIARVLIVDDNQDRRGGRLLRHNIQL